MNIIESTDLLALAAKFKFGKNNFKISKNTIKLIQVLARDGSECQCCASPAVIASGSGKHRISVYTRNFQQKMTSDHNLLKSLGGNGDVPNTKALCRSCNMLRGNKFAEFKEFKEWYDSVLQEGKKPADEIKLIKSNFSYIVEPGKED